MLQAMIVWYMESQNSESNHFVRFKKQRVIISPPSNYFDSHLK